MTTPRNAAVRGAMPSGTNTGDLTSVDIHGSAWDPAATAMTFLNEITMRYPDAISFAAGRPTERWFDLHDITRHVETYCAYLRSEVGLDEEQVRRVVMQYGRTKGIIHDLVARQLKVDEQIAVDPSALVITVGFQEGVLLVLRALASTPHDALLVVSPSYVGVTGAARLVDMPVLAVNSGTGGIDLADLRRQHELAVAQGLRPRALYIVPDFANPTGITLDVALRRQLLALATELDILVIEDNPYGLLGRHRLPTLKALDEDRRVIYIGSYAKTIHAGARVGFVIADQRIATGNGTVILADALASLKSVVTVNTSPIAQAVVGGKLIDSGFNLVRASRRETDLYERNRDIVLAGLTRQFGRSPTDIAWTTPAGGFFVAVSVPFHVTDELLELSARDFGVLWTPMRYFYTVGGGEKEIRLSYSSLTPETAAEGIRRLTSFVARHMT
ncbi:PLP-dependent aminotransferase family protein [Micromonospora parva]|uniref:aminotransferase-like domain-containing protein n=1 Tax=Micromonospora parva TaxID=1464048 RepID=UPI0033C5851B